MRVANNYPLLINFTSLVPASFTLLFEPSATASLESFSATKDFLVLQTLDTVKSRYIFWRYQDAASNEEGAPLGWSFRGAEESKFFAELCSVFHSDHLLSCLLLLFIFSCQHPRFFSVGGGLGRLQPVLAYFQLLPAGKHFCIMPSGMSFGYFNLKDVRIKKASLNFLLAFPYIVHTAHNSAAGRRLCWPGGSATGAHPQVPARAVRRRGPRGATVPGCVRGRNQGMTVI